MSTCAKFSLKLTLEMLFSRKLFVHTKWMIPRLDLEKEVINKIEPYTFITPTRNIMMTDKINLILVVQS